MGSAPICNSLPDLSRLSWNTPTKSAHHQKINLRNLRITPSPPTADLHVVRGEANVELKPSAPEPSTIYYNGDL